MKSDLDLLRQFARESSQDAFAEIVRRHLDLVYSAALRQVRSAQLAEEVAQSVFADLADDAAKLKPDTLLSAWLYTVTRRTAIDVIRKESRRRLREQIAVEMNNMNATESGTGVPPVWSEIEPFLDDAMAALDETDRSAILLRYFENKSLREVGEALGASEDAAQKRVSRAVERLREFFSKRKITIGASGLAVLISANAVQSAPVGLAATISAAALAGTAVSTSTVITATKVIAMTTLQKTLVTATVAVLAGAGVYEARQAAQLRNQVQMLRQQQAPLTEQVQKLQNSFADATNRLTDLLAENYRSKSNQPELLKLRGEVTRLRNGLATVAQLKADSELKDNSSGATNSYITTTPLSERVNRIQTYLLDHPEAGIPEIQFASPVKWLNSIQSPVGSDEQLSNALTLLRRQAMSGFMAEIRMAELEFEKANDGHFPGALAQLLPYLDSAKGQVMLDNYEIVPTKMIIDPNAHITGDWVIVRKTPVNPNSNSSMERLAAYAGGQSAWYVSDDATK